MLRRAAVALLLAACLSGVLGQSASASTVSVVSIGGRHYLTGNLQALGRKLVKTTAMRYVLDLVEQCRGVQVHGFVSSGGFGSPPPCRWASPGASRRPTAVRVGPSAGPASRASRRRTNLTPPGYPACRANRSYYVIFAGTSSTVFADIFEPRFRADVGPHGGSGSRPARGKRRLIESASFDASTEARRFLGQRTSGLPAWKKFQACS